MLTCVSIVLFQSFIHVRWTFSQEWVINQKSFCLAQGFK